jgi:hypothetical protein
MLENQLEPMSCAASIEQQGMALLQALVGMLVSACVVTAAFAAFAWVQNNHLHLQSMADLQDRLNGALTMVQERVAKAGAPSIQWDAQGKASLLSPAAVIQGTDSNLSLTHPSLLTPADCQGHQATTGIWIQDDFKRSTKNELSCKDSLRSNTSYQALVDNISQVGFLYAQVLSGPVVQMQWRSATQVTNWQAVRGVQVCVQTKTSVAYPFKPTQACNTTQMLGTNALAWRGVAFLRHGNP